MVKAAIVSSTRPDAARQATHGGAKHNHLYSGRDLFLSARTYTTLLCIFALACADACAFNVPQPIKHSDFFHLNGEQPAPAPGVPLLPPSTEHGTGLPFAPNTVQPKEGGSSVPVYTITQALNEGLLVSPRVAAARAQLEISKALYIQAAQMPNPVLFRDEAPIAEQTTRTGVQGTIQSPWKIAFRLLAAKRQVQQTKLQILQTLWQLRNDLRRAYTELVVAQESYQTLNDLASLAQALQNVTQTRFSAGDVPELDTMKAHLATSQTEIEMEQGRRRVLRARQQLNVLMGAQLDRNLAVPRLPRENFVAVKSELLPDFQRPVPELNEFVQLALANRLELRLIKQQMSVAQAQLYNATGNIIPDPVIGSGNSNAGNPPDGPKLHGVFFTLNFEMPLYSFSQGEIARLRATIVQLQRQVHAEENMVVAQVSAAYNNLTAAREKIRAYQGHVLADSEEVAHLARRSYEVGQSDITATLAAQQANIQVRSQYLDSVAAYQQAFTDLEQSIGEPLQ